MHRPLHIVVPIHSFEPGGVERVALNLAAAWHKANENVTIVLGRREGEALSTAPALDYACLGSRLPTARFETLWMIRSLWRFLRHNQADVLFCPGNTYAVVGAAMKLLLGRKCPPVAIKISNDLQRHDMPRPARFAYGLWLRLQGRLFEGVIAMSPHMRNEIVRLMKVAPDRIATIDNASLSETQFAALAAIAREAAPHEDAPHKGERPTASKCRPSMGHSPTGTGRRYLAIGRLVPQKHYSLMLRAFARGAAADSSLIILGEGPERARLEDLVDRLGLAGRVAMPGHCHDIVASLRQADTLLLSSDYEGVPSVVIEALAAGLPVIATNCCVSMAGMLGNGWFGHLVQPGDETQFARALSQADAEAATRRFPVEAARAKAQSFTVERAAPRYLAEFRTIRGLGRQPPTAHTQDHKSVI